MKQAPTGETATPECVASLKVSRYLLVNVLYLHQLVSAVRMPVQDKNEPKIPLQRDWFYLLQ